MSRFKLLGQIIYSLDRLAQLIISYDMLKQKCCFFIKIKIKHEPHYAPPPKLHGRSISILSQNTVGQYLSFVRNEILYHDLFIINLFFP
jgi:hypothetical protein